MVNFWSKLSKPFWALAPMDDVTDTAFRQVILSCGRPNIFFTEFVSSDGLCSSGKEKLLKKLQYLEKERPIVAQVWGVNPQHIKESAKLIKEMGFDGIDINMGCPDKAVIKRGGGGAMIENPALAKEVVLAAKEGAKGLPLSIKTRIGFKNIKTEEWIGFLLKLGLAALTVHGRTVAEQSKVSAHWEEIGKVIKIRDEMGVKTLIIGNGDINSCQEGLQKVNTYGVDGVMIGRGVFENPWIFNSNVDVFEVTSQEKIRMLLLHARIFNQTWGNKKNFSILKKFFKAYVREFDGASELRAKLMETNNLAEVEELVRSL